MNIFKEKILGYIKKHPKCELEDLKRGLKLDSDELEDLKNILFELEKTGQIYISKANTFYLIEQQPNVYIGKAHFSHDGEMYVVNRQNKKIIVPHNKSCGALEKDIVVAKKVFNDTKGNDYGIIEKIIERKTNQISCEVIFENGRRLLVPYNSKSKTEVKVDANLEKYGIGEILLIKLNNNNDSFDGKIIKTTGHRNDPDIDEITIALDHGFSDEFNHKVKKELEKIPTKANVKEALKEGRKDLRNINFFTIDGADTKDIDDAIAIELLPSGNYKLYVSIADVPYYVKEGTAIDEEAYKRGTSVYMNDTVLPMLPHVISSGICSLHPHVDRLTKTCEMIISPEGIVLDYDIYDSIINSKKKMTYDDVNSILENNVIPCGYEDFVTDLQLLQEISYQQDIIKKQRGYINFSSNDIKASGKGKNITFKVRKQNTGERIIENCMLLANETVAQHIFYRGLPFIYRVHERPSEEKMKEFIEFLEQHDFKFKKCKNITSNTYIQSMIEEVSKNDEFKDVFSELLLTSAMKKAKYSNINLEHFGLGLKIYTHFTSPIRRYSDLIVHRLLNLYKNNYNFDFIALDKNLSEMAAHCTKRSNEAECTEREARQMRMAEYLQHNIGKEFAAVVVGIDSSTLTIKTNEGFSGKININELKDDHYKYNHQTNTLIGKEHNKVYTLGTTINVIVKDASKQNQTVKFTISDNLNKVVNNSLVKTKKGLHN